MKSITLFSGYIYLILGIVTGIASNGFLKTTEGFTKLNPTIFRTWQGVGWAKSYWVNNTGGPSWQEAHKTN